jgi:hypothetical protein
MIWQLAWKIFLSLYLVCLALILNIHQVGDTTTSEAPQISSESGNSYSFRQSTPFTPLKPTQTYAPPRPVTGQLVSGGSFDALLSGLPIRLFLPALLTHTASIVDQIQSFTYEEIEFQAGSSRIILEITPPTRQVNGGKPIRVSFLPGDQCKFGDKHACVFSYRTNNQANVIFITIHSGVGGEGQKLRHAIEGTGINQAGLKLSRVLDNLEALEGASVSLIQGEIAVDGLMIYGLSRIPPKKIHEYFSLPVDQAIDYAASFDETLLPAKLTGQPLIVLETCGWKMPGESWAKDVTATTGSIYLGVIAPALVE